MSMRLLIVEDSDEIVELIETALAKDGLAVEVVRAACRSEAVDLVRGDDDFDLGVFDLRIPSDVGAPDADASFGSEVFFLAAEERPGLPSWVFSGFADADIMEELIRDPRRGDATGARADLPVVDCFRKSKAPELLTALVQRFRAVRSLGEVELSTGGVDLGLSAHEARLLRILLRRHGAVLGRLDAFEPGFSGSRVFRVVGVGGRGEEVLNCVAKIAERAIAIEEETRYRDGVASVLPAGCFAPLNEVLHVGSSRHSLLCYSLAGTNPRALVEVLGANEVDALGVLGQLRIAVATWNQGGIVEPIALADLMALLGAPQPGDLEPAIAGLLDANLLTTAFARTVQVRRCVQHGDLHLSNALVGEDGRPILIDFGRTTVRVAAYDPVTLEMCLFFHPDGRRVSCGWPTPQQAAMFDDLDSYVVDCPFAGFVRECRGWAHSAAVGDREVWASALAIALRQLRFPDPPERAAAIANRALRLLC